MSDAATVVALLVARGWRLGVAESLTGGALMAELVSVPGASRALSGGVVAYATSLKHSLLGVDKELLALHGPVHASVATQMAVGIRHTVAASGRDAEVGVATTGIAGPESPDGQPVGTVHVAVVTPKTTRNEVFHFDGGRDQIRAKTVAATLAMLTSAVRE